MGATMPRTAWLAMTGVWVVALATRLPAMDLSLWWDEAYTAVFYIARGPSAIFSADSFVVNNHVLFSLVSWPTAALLGDGEAVLRLWGLLPSLGSLAVLTWWARRDLGAWPAVLVGLAVAVDPLHQALSAQARGYGLGLLGASLMLVGAVRAHQRGRPRDLVTYGLGGLVATWTLLPTVLLFLAHAAVLVWRRSARRATVVTVAAVGLANVAFYRHLIPLILRYSQGAGLDEGIGTPWHAPVSVPATRVIGPVADWLLPGVPTAGVTAVAALVLGVAVWGLWRGGRRALLAHTAGTVTLTLLAMFVVGANIVDRYVSFLLLHVLVLVVVGLVEVGRLPATDRGHRLVRTATGLVVAVVTVASVVVALDRARVPREDYRRGAAIAEAADVDTVLLNRLSGAVGFRYYLGPDRVEQVAAADVADRTCGLEGPFVLFDYPLPGTDAHGDLSCVRDRATRVVEVEQRNERAPTYRVFVVGPR